MSGRDGLAILTWLDSLDVPVVLVERRAPHSAALRRLEWVSTDHDFGAKTLTTRLREGDRSIQRTVVLPELNVRESSAARLGG